MPFSFSTSDFSDYFTITSAPETFARTPSDSLSVSENLSVSVSLYVFERSHSQTLTLAESLSRSVDTWKFVSTLSDSFSLQESLSRSVDEWKFLRSLSDSFTVSDTFSTPVVTTYRTTNSASDSITNSESLNIAIDTWRHVVSYNMNLTPSESLSKSVRTYRPTSTLTDTLSPSDSLSLNVQLWFHIQNVSASLSLSDSISAVVTDWHVTNGDTANVSDELTLQISVDNDTYFWDSVSLETSSQLYGYISGSNFTSDSSRVSNGSALIDGNTNSPTTFTNSVACVVFDLGTQKQFNFLAVHLGSATENVKVYASNSQGTGYSEISDITTGSNVWTINEFALSNYRYVALQISNISSSASVNEIIVGKSFKPEVRYSLNAREKKNHYVNLSESYTGIEYAYRLKEGEFEIDRPYENMSETLKNDFENLWNLSSHKKFLYYFNRVNYVNMEQPTFDEIAYNRFQTNIRLST